MLCALDTIYRNELAQTFYSEENEEAAAAAAGKNKLAVAAILACICCCCRCHGVVVLLLERRADRVDDTREMSCEEVRCVVCCVGSGGV